MKIPETIPKIRVRLHELADEHGIEELHALAEATKRRTCVRKAPAKSRPTSPVLRQAVRAYAAANPESHQRDIAQVFDLNPGRVSEAIRGKRQ